MWLDRCSSRHERCRPRVHSELPTRLVAIGNLDDVKLVESETIRATPRYATLSYCWGREHFTILTRDNLQLFYNHIPLKELPRAFTDAIEVTRELGLEYIWIDALCIIQDEAGRQNSDWSKEAGRMRSVYGGSFVNIAASSATSVHQGFLRKGLRPYYHGGLVAGIASEEGCRVQNFSYPTEETFFDTHLASRAWAFQEKALPPRTLSFGDTGLTWECRSQVSSEFLPDGFKGWRGMRGMAPFLVPEDQPLRWTDVLEKYSKADLTYGPDRLPALSVIASRQQVVTGGQYLAGMWMKDLNTQLLWRIEGLRRSRPAWRAPTWSWTSVDGSAVCGVWVQPVCREYIKVLDAWTEPAGPDPFGAVAGGQLTLACSHLIRGDLMAGYGTSAGEIRTDMGTIISFFSGLRRDCFN